MAPARFNHAWYPLVPALIEVGLVVRIKILKPA
jgi:hypothetical protein